MSDETPQSEEEAEVAATGGDAPAEETPVEPIPGQTDLEDGEEPAAEEAPAEEEPAETDATTVGDLQAPADEHPVDSTPALDDADKGHSPAEGGHAAAGADGDAEPMVHEPGDPNERGNNGGDGTVWNG